jgi:hypothetical protein
MHGCFVDSIIQNTKNNRLIDQSGAAPDVAS